MTTHTATSLIPAADLPREATDTCDQIAYQYTAIVQPHAALLVLDPDTLSVSQASRSTQGILDRSHDDLLGNALGPDILDAPSLDRLSRSLADLQPNDRPVLIRNLNRTDGQELVARAHRTEDGILLEFEQETHEHDLTSTSADKLISAVAVALDENEELEDIAHRLCTTVRQELEFDRVMMYRFDADYNGEIIGEARHHQAADTFLGMHFPSSDIPKSARSMFAASGVRITVDQNTETVDLIPRINPVTERDTDLTLVRARGAAGSCQTYYQNMGVRSTIIIPIMMEDRIWGLLSCHHVEPCRPHPAFDIAFQMLGRLVSDAIQRHVFLLRSRAERQAIEVHRSLLSSGEIPNTIHDQLLEQARALRGMIDCGGFIIRVGEHIHTEGIVPNQSRIPEFLDLLTTHSRGEPFESNTLGTDFPSLLDLGYAAAGALVIPLLSKPGDVAVWVRPEYSQTVDWAGDPAQGLKWDQDGRPELTPRNSFKLWQTKTRGTCKRWTVEEVAIAETASLHIGLVILSWHTAQSSRSKTAFLANMSHEIRTPLTAILGFADILLDSETDESKTEVLSIVRRNGDHLLHLINDILDLSKIEAGKLELEHTEINPKQILTEACQLLGHRAEHKGISLQLELSPDLPACIVLDAIRFKQILVNLINNAVKFTEEGSVLVRAFVDQPGLITVEVTDTGIGMNDDELSRVFNPFEQADNSMNRRFGGTGLGLAISQRIASMMGGSITATSRKGQGSQFKLLLPVIAAEVTDAADEPVVPDKHPELSGTRVLVVEDGPDNQRLIGFMFRKLGVEITFASNGLVAIEKIEAGLNPDIILMDMQMPIMDGYDATRALRARGNTTPIIAVTAHAMQGDERRCLEAGCSAYASKPIDRNALVALMSKLVKEHRARKPEA